MKRVILEEMYTPEDLDDGFIFCMAKLNKKYADINRTGDFGEFVYFSECNDSHGPRVKFYGGSAETRRTKNCPSIIYGVEGEPELEVQNWMNRKNCPNAFNSDYVNKIIDFVKRTRPVLLLVWFYRLDENDAIHFFEGNISWNKLLSYVACDDTDIVLCKNMNDLNDFCIKNKLYTFAD